MFAVTKSQIKALTDECWELAHSEGEKELAGSLLLFEAELFDAKFNYYWFSNVKGEWEQIGFDEYGGCRAHGLPVKWEIQGFAG